MDSKDTELNKKAIESLLDNTECHISYFRNAFLKDNISWDINGLSWLNELRHSITFLEAIIKIIGTHKKITTRQPSCESCRRK